MRRRLVGCSGRLAWDGGIAKKYFLISTNTRNKPYTLAAIDTENPHLKSSPDHKPPFPGEYHYMRIVFGKSVGKPRQSGFYH
jgi:hypothetical protein